VQEHFAHEIGGGGTHRRAASHLGMAPSD